MLVAPKLENGIEINLVGEITSVPYQDDFGFAK
jgi:3-phosphoshikimate 1-carboxyvinyltransferase